MIDEDDWTNPYDIPTDQNKWVADYLNISLLDTYELGLYDFLYYLRDAFIFRLSKTEKGREYLSSAARMQETEPDREALRKKMQ